MNQKVDPPSKNAWFNPFGRKALAVGGEVGGLTLGIVLAAVFGGLALDNLFGTKPVIMILMVLASAPISLLLTFWVARRAVKEWKPPTSEASGKATTTHSSTKGDDEA